MDNFDDQKEKAPYPFSGACLGCGLGINVSLKTGNRQNVTWQSGKPNPLPIFEAPDGFWTPFLLPGLYLPGELIAPYHEENGLLYQPLSDADLVDILIAFAAHENVHQILLLGIIPATQRLAAANFYSTLIILLSRDFDIYLWEIMHRLNYVIEVIHNATAAMHEAAAIVENQIITPFNNPYIQVLSEESANQYALDKNICADFIQYYTGFHSIITELKKQFAPTPLKSQTIITLADYIISSAIDLQDLANDVLAVPKPITDTSLRDFMRYGGIPYLEVGKRTLKNCPVINMAFGGLTVYGAGRRLERTISAILSANFKRPRKMPEHYIDQLLYIAELVPELKLWLQSIDARHWVKRRILNVIADHQVYLEHYGFFLPLTEVWETDLSAFIAIKTRIGRKTLYIKRFGNQPEDFTIRAAKISQKYWITYSRQKDQPLGVIFNPYCRDGIPISPFGRVIYDANTFKLANRLYTLIFFESLRLQLAIGCGLVCPFKDFADNRCCGRGDILWQVYNLGLTAIDKARWHPEKWDPPECKLAKSKMPRLRNAKLPHCRIFGAVPLSRESPF